MSEVVEVDVTESGAVLTMNDDRALGECLVVQGKVVFEIVKIT